MSVKVREYNKCGKSGWKKLAGHRSLCTTMRYIHLGKGEKHRAIQNA